jgi:hypothetical protein
MNKANIRFGTRFLACARDVTRGFKRESRRPSKHPRYAVYYEGNHKKIQEGKEMNREKVSMVRSLQGSPASILIALMATGGSMLNKELCMWTGYSDKPIAEGVALLETLGMVQFNGRRYGWSIHGGGEQLGLFDQSRALPAKAEQAETEAKEVAALPGHSLTEESKPPPPQPQKEDEETYRQTSMKSEIFRVDVINPQETYRQTSMKSEIFRVGEDQNSRRSTNTRARPFSSSSSLSLSFDPLSLDLVEEEKEIKNKEKWLLRAGIGKGSPKMYELLSAGLELEYIKAHVLEYEWSMANEHPPRLCIGTLIVRCEECKEVKCYCDLVRT